MAMCKNCGNEVAAGARFCSTCGAPQDNMPAVPMEQLYIDAEELGTSTSASLVMGGTAVMAWQFVARVDTPNGSYPIETSGRFYRPVYYSMDNLPGSDRAHAQETLNAMHARFLADGWRRTDSGSRWTTRVYERPFVPTRAYTPLPPAATPEGRKKKKRFVAAGLVMVGLCMACGGLSGLQTDYTGTDATVGASVTCAGLVLIVVAAFLFF
jgi:hypothetical protein